MELLTGLVAFATLIAGANEFITRLRGKDYWVATTIATSALIGALLGHFDPLGLAVEFGVPVNWAVGAATGLATSGLITIVGSFGNKSATAPSGVLKH